MLRWSLLLLAVVAVLAGLFGLLANEPASRPEGVELPTPAAATPRAADDGPGAQALVGVDDPRRPSGSPTGPVDQRQAVDDGPRGPLAVWVETAGGGPVARARVTLLDRMKVEGWQGFWEDPARRDAFVRRYGTTHVADERGRLTVPGTNSGALVGMAAGLSGMFEWSGPVETPIRLVLHPELDLKVRVVDGRGRPQPDVRVSIVRELAGQSLSVLTRKTVGEEGVAVFGRVGRHLGGGASNGQRHHVTLGFPCQDPPRIALDPAALPREVLVLELPPVGSVELRVVDERGLPVTEVTNASLGRLTPGVGGPAFFAEHNERVVGGSASFTYVGVDAPLAIKLSGSRDRPDLIEEHAGPSRSAEVKRITLRWTDRYPVILGVAVSETGEVLKARRGRYTVWSEGGGSGGPPLVTGPDGSLRLVITSPLEAQPGRRAELELYASDGERPLEAVLDLSGRLSPGESDLGHLTFQPRRELVSGVIRDVGGNGLTGVHVRVLLQERGRPGRAANFAATTLGDGSFMIYGSVDGPFELVAVRRGYKTVREPGVLPGRSGLEVVMVPDLPDAGDGRR